jgi:hypothetical protein
VGPRLATNIEKDSESVATIQARAGERDAPNPSAPTGIMFPVEKETVLTSEKRGHDNHDAQPKSWIETKKLD